MDEIEKKIGKVQSFTFDEVVIEKSQDSSGNEVRKIKGYANKATIDRGNDIVLPEAYKGTMDEFMKNPLVFFNHDWDTPIGKITDFQIEHDGLFVTAVIATGLEVADKVWKMIEQGILKAFSIGFVPKEIDYDSVSGAFIIKDLELLEVSVVTIPMNAQSLFEISKGVIKNITMQKGDKWLSYKSLIKQKIEEDNAPQIQKFEFIDGKCAFCEAEGKNLFWGTEATGKTLSSCFGCFTKFWGENDKFVEKSEYEKLQKWFIELTDKAADLDEQLSKTKELLMTALTKITEIICTNIAKT